MHDMITAGELLPNTQDVSGIKWTFQAFTHPHVEHKKTISEQTVISRKSVKHIGISITVQLYL